MTHKGTYTLETERLILRQFTIGDADEMFRNWASCERVTKYLTWVPHSSIEVTQKILEEWINSYKNTEYYNWGIYHKKDSQLIGSIGAVDIDNDNERITIGYCIGENWWGKGLTSEAFISVIKFFFEDINAERIQSYFHKDNIASGKVMEKSGLQYEGNLRNYGKDRFGNFTDCVFYGVIKNDYFSTAKSN